MIQYLAQSFKLCSEAYTSVYTVERKKSRLGDVFPNLNINNKPI